MNHFQLLIGITLLAFCVEQGKFLIIKEIGAELKIKVMDMWYVFVAATAHLFIFWFDMCVGVYVNKWGYINPYQNKNNNKFVSQQTLPDRSILPL